MVSAATVGGITWYEYAEPMVATFEGKRNHAYKDVVGIPTICYGSTQGVKMGDYKTDEECSLLLKSELEKRAKVIDRIVTVPITEPQKAALVSFMYNVGEGAFRGSTLLKKLNRGDYSGACSELKRWVYAGGKKWKGLITRRDIEEMMCRG